MENNTTKALGIVRNVLIWIPLVFGTILIAGVNAVGDEVERPGDFISMVIATLLLIVTPLFLMRLWNQGKPKSITPSVWFIALAGTVALVLMLYGAYKQTFNYFTWKEEQLQASFSELNTVYEQRFNVITNSAQITTTFSQNEREMIENITSTADAYQTADSLNEKISSLNTLNSLAVTVNNNTGEYPNLQSASMYQELLDLTRSTEVAVQQAKVAYNEHAREFNSYARSFPYALLVGGIVEEPRKEYLSSASDPNVQDAAQLLDGLE